MITVLTFLFFYFLIYFLGRGISIIFKLKIKEIYDVPLNVLYPVLALFYIGNVTLLINFLFPIDTLVSLILITFPLLTNISKFSLDSLNFSIKKLTTFVFTPLIFGISSSDINLHYDAGLYHLNHQKWLQTEKIVFGLSNNHNRFGYSSIIEYINVNFWLDNNLILLHFTNLIFIVVFFQIVYLLLFTKNYKFSASLLVYGFFDNFGFNGGKNGFIEIESIAKQDIPFAIIFILSTYFIFQAFTSLEKNKQILSIIFMLCLFSIQLRLLGFLNILFLIFVLIYKYKVARTFKIIFLENTFLVFIGFLFLIKNLITSSCLFYPISITCVNFLPWSNTKYANPITENNALADYHNAITRENYLNWFSDWTSQEVNFIVFKNVLLTFSIIIIFNLVIKFLKIIK